MTILMLETIDTDGMAVLAEARPILMSPSPNAHEHDLPLEDVEAIITRGQGQLDGELIEKCPNLKVIGRCGAGLNNIDLEAASERSIPVVFSPGFNATAVAEHALMLMLATARAGFATGLEVKQGNWACRDQFDGDDISGRRVCIVGGGNIGSKTAELCRALSMDVEICSRSEKGVEGLKTALKRQIPTSDIVSIHIPLNNETRHIFDRALLSTFKPGAILINTARGELVETGALLEALNDGTLSAYGADVLEVEPPSLGDPLVNHPGAFITPHVAGLTKRTYREMSLFAAKNVVCVLAEGTPDPASIYGGAIR